MKAGDVVVICTNVGLENRYGWLGVVRGCPAPGTWDVFTKEPTESGYLSTYQEKDLEVIDEMEPIEEPEVPLAAIREIKRVSRATETLVRLSKLPADPECYSYKDKAAYWESEYRNLALSETQYRKRFAEYLSARYGICPATWECIFNIMKENLK